MAGTAGTTTGVQEHSRAGRRKAGKCGRPDSAPAARGLQPAREPTADRGDKPAGTSREPSRGAATIGGGLPDAGPNPGAGRAGKSDPAARLPPGTASSPPSLPMPPAQPPSHLLYLHGFRSSPRSFKARCLLGWLARNQPQVQTWCPQLPPSPRAALALLQQGTATWHDGCSPGGPVVVGSSLGGFYATVLAETRGWPALVINPAVDPARDLAAHVGHQTGWHDPAEHFAFRPEFVDELRALTPHELTQPQRYAALIARGDELLDWREMAARYAGARLQVLPGSDHAVSDFDHHLPWVLQALGLEAAA